MKRLLLLIAVFAIATTAHAQIHAGVKAGFNLETVIGDVVTDGQNALLDDVDRKLKPGFYFGGYLNIGLNERLSFQPELLFSTAGTKITKSESSGYNNETTWKLSYLSIPLSIQYSFGNFNVHAGPQVSFLLRARQESRTKFDGGGRMDLDSDVSDFTRKIDLGLNIGAGYSFGKLGIHARYSFGLSNIHDRDEAWQAPNSLNTHNSVIRIGFTYLLFSKAKDSTINQ